jgi:hypothetical protein
MTGTLGICASNSNALSCLIGITKAAVRAGKRVKIFITGDAARFTQNSGFAELAAISEVSICEVSYFAAGYKNLDIPGLADKDFVTQAENAELIDSCDRYLLI